MLRAPWLGSSEMARMIRGFDWSATPLGPLEDWSPSLRTSVAMCLHSRFPIVVYWGRELIYLYNDANRDAIGQLHPRARLCPRPKAFGYPRAGAPRRA